MDLGKELYQLRKKVDDLIRSSRLGRSSIENAAVQVYDGAGSLRGILGVQADGTTAVNIVNGVAPPIPATPTVSPALGGIAVGWDGTFADGSAVPLDWSRTEVHTSTTAGFTPTAATLQATIETAQGGILYVPATASTYVCLVARNTSGAASTPTPVVGPYSPRPVAGDIGIGEITATMISDGAVTTPKLYANAVTTSKLAAGSVDATAIAVDALTGKIITGGTITGSLIQTAASGEHITLNEGGVNKVLVYDSTNTIVNELSSRGLLVKGINGAVIWLDPNDTFPNLRLTNAPRTASAVINVSGATAILGLNSGFFTSGTDTDWKWRTIFGGDYWVAERTRDSAATSPIGGRLDLRETRGSVGYQNSADTTQNTYLHCSANLMRANFGGSDKLTVDSNGNLTVAGIGQRITKRRTTNLTRTSTATATNDTQITFTVDANAVYAIEGVMYYSGPGDFQMGWTYPSGCNGTWNGLGNGTTVVSGTGGGGTQQDIVSTWGYTVRTETTDLPDNRTYGGIGANSYAVQVRGTLRVGSTGGTFALVWAQGTSNATGTILYTDSRITLEKIG
ncbi:hypothetical protein [Streptomyces sp. NPDC101249]|uniref:hypothetical protein n=1 Tax=Streptomyces sp. NPDC101249 TaxID=3366140 RepID=UPI00382ED659